MSIAIKCLVEVIGCRPSSDAVQIEKGLHRPRQKCVSKFILRPASVAEELR